MPKRGEDSRSRFSSVLALGNNGVIVQQEEKTIYGAGVLLCIFFRLEI